MKRLILALALIAGSCHAQITNYNQGGTSGTAPFGVAISGCQQIPAPGTYYLNSDVSSSGTCFSFTAEGIILNLHGHTITYNTANQTLATSAILGIQCWETDVPNVQGTCGDYENPTIYNDTPGSGGIVEGAGQTAFNNTCAAVPNCTNTVPSHPIRLGGSGSTTTGPTIYGVKFTWNCPSCLAVALDYGNAPVPGGALIHDNNLANGKTGAYCTGNSGALNCQPYRFVLAGGSLNVTNASHTTVPAQIYNNTVTGGVQGGLDCDAPGCIMQNNTVTPGNSAIEYTNNFALYAWWCGQTIENNTIGSMPPSANFDTRGISVDLTETNGAGCTGNTVVKNNTVYAFVKNDNTEYGGCSIGGAYGIQIDDDGMNSTLGPNTVVAMSSECAAAGLRVTQLGTGDTSTNSTYTGVLCATATCGFNATSVPTKEYPVAGGYFDGGVTYPAFVSTGDKFIGDFAAIAFDYNGSGPIYLKNCTLGSGANPTDDFVTVSYWNGGATSIQTYLQDCTFTGLATKTLTNMEIGNGDPYQLAQFFVQDTYAGVVKNSEGSPVSGATVSIVSAQSVNECTATTAAYGTFSCMLTDVDVANSTTVAQIDTEHNPHVATVSAAGCTPNVNSGLSVTSTTTGVTITLTGC